MKTEVGRNMPRQRSGQISVEALAPRASLWALVLNDLNDDFCLSPRGIWAGNMPRQELGHVLYAVAETWAGYMMQQEFGQVGQC
ncbi:hypothetical protein V6N11_031754 [Hibiscus sabdariffa]|uniref:Uncharacterized protein n=1 Tax=Hibiscus sabdariffa TaxID=183260 RepID=A0ABR2SYL1_9ROSI